MRECVLESAGYASMLVRFERESAQFAGNELPAWTSRRGSLFGRFVAAAVILDPTPHRRPCDSKKLPAEGVKCLALRIREHSLACGRGGGLTRAHRRVE